MEIGTGLCLHNVQLSIQYYTTTLHTYTHLSIRSAALWFGVKYKSQYAYSERSMNIVFSEVYKAIE